MKGEKLFTKVFLTLTFVSGLTLFVLKNFFTVENSFGLESHPLLDEAKIIHYVFTPFMVLRSYVMT